MNRRQKIVQRQFLDDEARIIDQLDTVYEEALVDIDANIEKLMKRFDPETGDLPQSAIYQLRYQKYLKAQVEGELNRLRTGAFTTVSNYLDDCYTNGFVGSLYDMHGQGVPLAMPINQESMIRAVQLDSNIKEGLYTRMGVDVEELRNRITAQVSRGIATGASWKQVAKQLDGEMRIGYNKAVRIARTEGHRIQNQAKMDSMDDAVERGADLVKQWDATLDGKTRDSHAIVDGEFREKDEEFSNGLQFPGDPDGSAAEVINCRCALLMRARWAMGNGFTKMNNFTKELETFESPQAYDDFKEGFFAPENKQYMNYVQEMERKYGTKNFPDVLENMTDREYNHYTDLLAKNPMYNMGTRSVTKPATRATLKKIEPVKKVTKKVAPKKTEPKLYTHKELNNMTPAELRKVALDMATRYYESGKSGIHFGKTTPKRAAELLVAQGTPASLRKDIYSMQKRLYKK